ncbi:hypothetical protein DFH07DRAFT_830702 [Mycena maculata]|uniref:Uncharacterized protein n=1 Tax=Mycena maculata TaxID=230809 RepID=A0AAD7ISL9_9AGAR|nr:hypothetical protein DFH07DRAFT_830702 [Mycena maculata]
MNRTRTDPPTHWQHLQDEGRHLPSELGRREQETRDLLLPLFLNASRLGRKKLQFIRRPAQGLCPQRPCTTSHLHIEVGETWLQQVFFSFETPEAMLDKLTNIPTATRSLIRHARVSGELLMLSWPEGSVYYRTFQTLKLLPGLALDRLTVLGPRAREVRYETLDTLVRYGIGWKELYYLSHDSAFLAYEHDWFSAVYLRVPQPAGWQRALNTRDGPASGASVVIYRAITPRSPGAVLHPATRVTFAQTLPAGSDLLTFGKVADSALMAPGEREKEVLVVVKRGGGLDHTEKEGSPYLDDGDIREVMPGMTWKQITAELA